LRLFASARRHGNRGRAGCTRGDAADDRRGSDSRAAAETGQSSGRRDRPDYPCRLEARRNGRSSRLERTHGDGWRGLGRVVLFRFDSYTVRTYFENLLGPDYARKRRVDCLDVVDDASRLTTRPREDARVSPRLGGHPDVVELRILVGAEVDLGGADVEVPLDERRHHGIVPRRNAADGFVQNARRALGHDQRHDEQGSRRHHQIPLFDAKAEARRMPRPIR
jgi:hypothetical protein